MLVEGEPGGEPLHDLLLSHPSKSLSGSVPQGGGPQGQQGGPPPGLHPLPAQEVAMTTAAPEPGGPDVVGSAAAGQNKPNLTFIVAVN